MNRRDLIRLLGGAAAASPGAMRAQQLAQTLARIGFLGTATAAGSANAVDALRSGLRELGYVEGRNIVIEFRWAEERYDRLPQLVRELVSTQLDLITERRSVPGSAG
jgi:putative ABC transport system substrate-binding protein